MQKQPVIVELETGEQFDDGLGFTEIDLVILGIHQFFPEGRLDLLVVVFQTGQFDTHEPRYQQTANGDQQGHPDQTAGNIFYVGNIHPAA